MVDSVQATVQEEYSSYICPISRTCPCDNVWDNCCANTSNHPSGLPSEDYDFDDATPHSHSRNYDSPISSSHCKVDTRFDPNFVSYDTMPTTDAATPTAVTSTMYTAQPSSESTPAAEPGTSQRVAPAQYTSHDPTLFDRIGKVIPEKLAQKIRTFVDSRSGKHDKNIQGRAGQLPMWLADNGYGRHISKVMYEKQNSLPNFKFLGCGNSGKDFCKNNGIDLAKGCRK